VQKIAIIGTNGSIYGFRSLGIDIFAVENKEQASRILNEKSKDYSIIFIEENFYEQKAIAENESGKNDLLSVIPLPLKGNYAGTQFAKMNEFIKKTIGISEL